jgi:hypothetical protein
MQRFARVEALFKGRHFDGQIIILCVSWYTSFKLSLRDLVIMMADRGIPLAHTIVGVVVISGEFAVPNTRGVMGLEKSSSTTRA